MSELTANLPPVEPPTADSLGFPAVLRAGDRYIADYRLHCPENDSREIVKTFALMRSTYGMLVGPTGVGKSILMYQMALCWSIGKPVLGFRPAMPASTWLLVQAENEEYDVARARDGILEHMRFTEAERQAAGRRVVVTRCDDGTRGLGFFKDFLQPRMADYRPTGLMIDPVLEFVDGNINERETASLFTRRYLLGMLKGFEAAGLISHHTPKPPQTQRAAWKANEQAYAAMGSVEFANPARFVTTLAATDMPKVFALWITKKWQEVGWLDEAGLPTNMQYLTYAPGDLPCWMPHDGKAEPVDKGGGSEGVLGCVPLEGWVDVRQLVEMAKTTRGIQARSTLDQVDVLVSLNCLERKEEDCRQLVRRVVK